MKKLILRLFICSIFILSVSAESFPDIKYKNIGNHDKISYDSQTDTWSRKILIKNNNYFIKTKGFGDSFDYLDSNKNYAFSTDCEYDFIYNNSLIGYSNRDLCFYDIKYIDGEISKRRLSKEEVQKIFPNYNVISLSDFSHNTNAYKIKKSIRDLKVIIINDSDKTFDNYTFSSGNAKFKKYSLRSFITISKAGMIQFSGDNTNSDNPWFILLIR